MRRLPGPADATARLQPWDDPKLAEEARDWLLLAQFDSDDTADMNVG